MEARRNFFYRGRKVRERKKGVGGFVSIMYMEFLCLVEVQEFPRFLFSTFKGYWEPVDRRRVREDEYCTFTHTCVVGW